MTASIKEIKKRIDSTKKTGQITKAMYMVSQAKVKKSEKTYKNYQDFLTRNADLIRTALAKKTMDYSNPLLEEREVKRVAYLLITSDTGLAGAYNANIFKYFESIPKDADFVVGTIGRKGYAYIKSSKYSLLNDSAIFVRDDVMFIDIVPLTNKLVKLYQEGKIDKLVVIYNHYINTINVAVKEETLLPIKIEDGNVIEKEYLFEGGIQETLDQLLPMYIESKIYNLILDAKVSEHSSRMNSMKNASDNVDDIVSKLQLIYNQARQAAITSEILDIIAGSNAILNQADVLSATTISDNIKDIYSDEHKIVYATVKSNKALEVFEEEAITKVLSSRYPKKSIELISKIDSSINEGYQIFVNGTRLDLSMDSIINNLKNSL